MIVVTMKAIWERFQMRREWRIDGAKSKQSFLFGRKRRMDTRGSILAYQYFRKSSTRVKQRNNILKLPYGKGRTVDRVRRTRPVKRNKQHWNKIIKKIIPKEVAKNAEMVKSSPSPDPEDLKDTAEDLLIFLKREDVFIYNGNTIEYHVSGPRWKNYTWKIDLNKT